MSPQDRRTDEDPWSSARETTRRDVAAALSLRERRCPDCGHLERSAGRRCSHCGADLFARRRRWRPGRRALVAAAAGAVALAAVGVAVVPGLRRGAEEEATRERERQAALLAAEIRRLRAEVRPHRGAATPRRPGQDALAHRRSLVLSAEAAVAEDARARVRRNELRGPILGTDCSPYPATTERRRRERDPKATVGRYDCLAVTRRFPLPELEGRRRTGLSGHPFWVVVDYARARYVWCKVTPKAGEGAKSLAAVPVPPPCREPRQPREA